MKLKKIYLLFVGLSLVFSLLNSSRYSIKIEKPSEAISEYLAEKSKSEKISDDKIFKSHCQYALILNSIFHDHDTALNFYAYIDKNVLLRPPITL